METNEMQMSSNVAIPVSNNATLEVVSEVPRLDDQEIVEVEEVRKVSKNTNDQIADDILNSAREEGFEQALSHLANGDFNIQEENLNKEETIKGDEDQALEPEGEALEEQIKELKNKALEFEDVNKELKDRVKSLERYNETEMYSILELARLIYELIKKEEDEKKKASMLEVVVNIIAALMKAMFIPESEQARNQKEQQDAYKSKNSVLFEDIVLTLVRNREEKTLKDSKASESHLPQAA